MPLFKDKADILNRQYQSVFTHEDPDSSIPDPGGDPFPAMKDITVNEESERKLLQKSNQQKASGPDMIPARLLKEYADDLAPILHSSSTSPFNQEPFQMTGKVQENRQGICCIQERPAL